MPLGGNNLNFTITLSDLTAGGFGAVAQQIDRLDNSAERASKQGGFLRDAFSFATGGLIASGIGAITSGLGSMFGNSINEAREAQTGFKQLEAVLTSTKGVVGLTADQIANMSTRLSASNGMSKFSDDAVLAGANILLTFTNIKGSVFEAANAIAGDMATALGGDPQSQAIMLGKALNDPIAGMGALRRVGVAFTEQQEKTIKTMMAAGNVMGAQKIILAELATEFGGSAVASMQTFDGKMIQMQESLNGVYEEIGNALLPTMMQLMGFMSSDAVMGTIQTVGVALAEGLGRAVEYISAGVGRLQAAWTAISPTIMTFWNAAKPVVDLLSQMNFYIQTGEKYIGTAGGAWFYFTEWMFRLNMAIGDLVNVAFPGLGTGFQVAAISLDGLLLKFTPVIDGAANVLKIFSELGIYLQTGFAQGGIAGAMDFLGLWAIQAGEHLGKLKDVFVGVIAELAPPIIAQLQVLGGQIWAWIEQQGPPVLDRLNTLMTQILTWAGGQKDALLTQIQTWATAFVDWIPGATVAFLQAWPGMLNTFLNEFEVAAGPIAQKILTWIPPMLLSLAAAAGAILVWVAETAIVLAERLEKWRTAFIQWIAPMVQDFVQRELPILWAQLQQWLFERGVEIGEKLKNEWIPAFTKWLGEAQKITLAELGKLADGINAWLNASAQTLQTEAGKIGSAVVNGITSGIEAGKQALRNKIAEIAASLPQWLKDLWDIRSPSGVMAEEIGLPLMQGIEMGITGYESNLIRSFTGVLRSMLEDGVATVKGSADAINGDMEKIGDGMIQHLAAGMYENIGVIRNFINGEFDMAFEKFGFSMGGGGGKRGGGNNGLFTDLRQNLPAQEPVYSIGPGFAMGGFLPAGGMGRVHAGEVIQSTMTGTRIYNQRESSQMFGNGGGNTYQITINTGAINSELDMQRLAYLVAVEIGRKQAR